MGEKRFLSFYIVAAYGIAVVAICVTLGLLVSLVNKDTCVLDENGSRSLGLVQNEKVLNKKREIKQNANDEKMDELRQKVKEHNSPFMRSKLASRNWFTRIDGCPEFTQSQNGTLWEAPRLPKSVIPNDYEIELYTPIFDYELYEGLSLIKSDLSERTDTFIVHAKLLLILGIGILDRDLKPIDIKCAGPYPYNDYWVIKTQQPVERVKSPVTLEYLYAGFLNVYESGLFEIKYIDGVRNNMLASHFEPLDARKAFPCFDEPSLKATFEFLIDHPIDTIALSNMPAAVS
jgi:hypothetical protein